MRKSTILLFASFTLILVGCNRLPDGIHQRAKKVPGLVQSTEKKVDSDSKQFEQIQQTRDYSQFKQFAERENWSGDYVNAKKKISDAKNLESKLTTFIKNNSKDDLAKVNALLDRITVACQEAEIFARKPLERFTFLKKVKATAPALMKNTQLDYRRLTSVYQRLQNFISETIETFPNKKGEIEQIIAQALAFERDAKRALDIAEAQMKSSAPDYAIFGDACKIVSNRLTQFADQDGKIRSKLSQLSKSYSKTLVDMRVDYYVTIGRCSWDEDDDYGSEHNYTFSPRKVSSDNYEYLSKNNGTIARIVYGFFSGSSLEPSIPGKIWNSLNITYNESMSNWDDSAEFWVEDFELRCYHKYLMEENGRTKETSWVEVDEEDFFEYADALGMTILSKPYGYFESEILEDAMPPGMAYVGNPKYGEWKTNPQTREREWSWLEIYGMYHLMGGGGSRYSYNEWDHWNRNYRDESSYYGRNHDKPTYGTRSSTTRSLYKNSTFNKSGVSSDRTFSARSAATRTRSRGPGGGGK